MPLLSLKALGNSGASKTVSWLDASVQTLTLTANCTITFSDPVVGVALTLILTQDGTGSRTITIIPTPKWAGGVAPTLTTTPGKTDILSLLWDGTSYLGIWVVNC